MIKDKRPKAHSSRAAIQRLYIAMRHLFIRGGYKPLGVSGEAMIEALMTLGPEIYGDIGDPERVELEGLLYIFERLPQGIEECRYVKLIAREGYEQSHFQPLVPSKRRRNCYRIDKNQMFIEMTRGRSDIYDVLTHLTFMYIEADKIKNNSLNSKRNTKREWELLERIVQMEMDDEPFNKEVAYSYLSTLLGRTFEETVAACEKFAGTEKVNSIFHITYWLGKCALNEEFDDMDREISFSNSLREKIGHHIYGELWANTIKETLIAKKWYDRPLHIFSANLHSVMNAIYGCEVLRQKEAPIIEVAQKISLDSSRRLSAKIKKYALKNGMIQIDDQSGTNISVQLFDFEQIPVSILPDEWKPYFENIRKNPPLLLVMDYAFGEQAFESMDELLKPYQPDGEIRSMCVASINIMGKAGILTGKKGDIMVPTAHVFEGSADNYPIQNALERKDFDALGVEAFEGPMITVLGTSLQNKEILRYFAHSTWKAIGLEMEGAHYQKAIQSASKIRNNISPDVTLRYAYYASDNPLISGQTLASGGLGVEGVLPTYTVTLVMMQKLFNSL